MKYLKLSGLVLAISVFGFMACAKKSSKNSGSNVLLALLLNQPKACTSANATPSLNTTVTYNYGGGNLDSNVPSGATQITVNNAANSAGTNLLVIFRGSGCLALNSSTVNSINAGSSNTYTLPTGTQRVEASLQATVTSYTVTFKFQ